MSALQVGDWVEVLSLDQILRTLDDKAECERMPFMPEMARFAGQRFQVSAVAHKTCDTVNLTGGRKVKDAIHLADLRCDGSGHGGCQAACLLYWKTNWLRSVQPGDGTREDARGAVPQSQGEPSALKANAVREESDGMLVYSCQATTLPNWSTPLAWWDARQYVRDVRSGNVSASIAIRTLFLAALRSLLMLPFGWRVWDGLFSLAHRLIMKRPSPFAIGAIPRGLPTPDERTDLRVGERVRLKDHARILATLNTGNRNRGLSFDPEMAVYCGGEYQVAARVEKIVDEKTGRMTQFANPCIRLDGVTCKAWYSSRRHLCPRRITPYFREIWLERVERGQAQSASPDR